MKHSMGYTYPDDIARANAAYDAWGDDPEQLFCSAGKALANVMIRNVEAIQGFDSRSFHLCSENIEMLLFNFLQEIINYKNTQQLLLAHFQITITCSGTEWVLNCKALGERFDPLRHEQMVDVKAITLQHFKLSQNNEGWAAHVVLDS